MSIDLALVHKDLSTALYCTTPKNHTSTNFTMLNETHILMRPHLKGSYPVQKSHQEVLLPRSVD